MAWLPLFHHAGVLAFGPCWGPKLQFSLFSSVLCGFWKTGSHQQYKSHIQSYSFIIIVCVISLSSNEHMFSCPGSIPPVLSIICCVLFQINMLLYWCHTFPSILPSLTSLHLLLNLYIFLQFPLPPSFPTFRPYSVPPFPLCCAHLCDCLLLTHSTSASPQMRAKGRVWCRA